MKNLGLRILSPLIVFSVLSCQPNTKVDSMIEKKLFGSLPGSGDVYEYVLTNSSGMKAKIINYGAIVVSLQVPDKNGKVEDVILGYDNLEGYVNDKSYQGAIVGRYGNRIAGGKFSLNGVEYQLTKNDGENHLHGGNIGFFKSLWTAEQIETGNEPSIKLSLLSKDGDEGYPGNVNIQVIYTITNNNELKIDYTASTDKQTIINPTHHSYFNLTGNPTNKIIDHKLMINADSTTEVGPGLITTGKLLGVTGTPMDFRKPKKIGLEINSDDDQLKLGLGYDHNWALNNFNGNVNKVAELYDAVSGRLMEIFTDQPGLQFYSGNFLDGSIKGKYGINYQHRTGLCLETQLFPDSPNKQNFHSPVLNPGETYKQTTIYKFSVK